ncbi:MAG: hypothetical protein K0B11_06610 [Mariniphaga sp.]|nr:hypothetical protein [Mariniphaga sp.]
MNSVILQLAAKYLKWLFIVFAVLALIRGHNSPGGGFIGGLMAGLAIVYNGFAYDTFRIKERLQNFPEWLIAGGLFVIVLSFFPSLLLGETIMSGVWLKISLPLVGELKLGSPLLFDIGVFFTVIGVTLMFIFSLTQKR